MKVLLRIILLALRLVIAVVGSSIILLLVLAPQQQHGVAVAQIQSGTIRRREIGRVDGDGPRRRPTTKRTLEWGRRSSSVLHTANRDLLVVEEEDANFWIQELQTSSSSMSFITLAPTTRSSDAPTSPSKPTPVVSSESPSPSPTSPPTTIIPPTTVEFTGWNPLGESFDGGIMVELSKDGNIVAVGSTATDSTTPFVHVFRRMKHSNNATTTTTSLFWEQLGSDIVAPPLQPDDTFMNLVSIALSADGSVLAMATQQSRRRSGLVRVFQWINEINNWVQIGQDISGNEPQDHFGYSVSLSGDGSIVAAGAPFAPDRRGPGYVAVYKFEPTSSVWEPMGRSLVGVDDEENNSGFGYSLDLSADGYSLVVGAPYNAPNGLIWGGRVHVFEYNNLALATWESVATIDGETELDQFGLKVAISDDGATIAATSISSTGTPRGLVRVFRRPYSSEEQQQEQQFVQIGEPLVGETTPNILGEDLDLSADGNIIAVGDTQLTDGVADDGSGGGGGGGYVRVMMYNGSNWETVGPLLTSSSSSSDHQVISSRSSFGRSVTMSTNDGIIVGVASGINSNDGIVGIYKAEVS